MSTPTQSLLRDGWFLSLCASRALISFNFIIYPACLPVLQVDWGMSATAAGSISAAFQIGYGTSLLAASWLSDRLGARNVYRISVIATIVAVIVFALFARSYVSGLVLYGLLAAAQGGTYTTLIMLAAQRYKSHQRGAAVGGLIGAASFGYALALLAAGLALGRGGYVLAFQITAVAVVLGCALGWFALRKTPNVLPATVQRPSFAMAVLRNRPAIRLTTAYIFHSWELSGMWAWTPAFLAAVIAMRGTGLPIAEFGAYFTAGFHIVGLAAASSMGYMSDRFSRRAVLVAMAAVSTMCSFAFGWLVAWPIGFVLLVGAIYSFAALGDSPVLSAAMTEVVDSVHLGGALAVRSLLGFGAGALAPLAFGAVLDATNAADTAPLVWGWAFTILGVGGLLATWCAWGFKHPR